MIVVVCVLMVTMIICLTIIVGAYQTVATTNNGGRDVAYYQQALSFSELLKKKLTGTQTFTGVDAAADLSDYLISYACDMSDFQAIDGTEIPEPSPISISAKTESLPGVYGNILLLVKKKKMSSTRVKLFITVNVGDGDVDDLTVTSDYNVLATVTAGYDISNIRTEGTDQKADVAFWAYY